LLLTLGPWATPPGLTEPECLAATFVWSAQLRSSSEPAPPTPRGAGRAKMPFGSAAPPFMSALQNIVLASYGNLVSKVTTVLDFLLCSAARVGTRPKLW
jgi:hypothetical protein